MKATFFIVALIGALAAGVIGQITPDEAMQQMREREAAATQPDNLIATISELRETVTQQNQQIISMRAEIESLKKDLAKETKIALDKFDDGKAYDPNDPIDALGALRHLPKDMVESMHAGKPTVGMPEESLKLFASVYTQSDAGASKVIFVTSSEGYWRVLTNNGVVVEVDKPLPASQPPEGHF